mmetsp:Transcript_33745/g.77867  ORF Transcript_33745/g.77867 Transcript_33745/m.77867 type:complete len:85 (-) Transcript_33745:18-272(-)
MKHCLLSMGAHSIVENKGCLMFWFVVPSDAQKGTPQRVSRLFFVLIKTWRFVENETSEDLFVCVGHANHTMIPGHANAGLRCLK